MSDILSLRPCVLWVGGSAVEMEAVRGKVGSHLADFIALPDNANVRRWLHMFENRIPLTCIVTSRSRPEDGGELAAENLILYIRGLSTWNSIRIMVFCSRPDLFPSQHVTLLTRVSSDIAEVMKFVAEHCASAGAGLTTTFRMVTDPKQVDSRIRQVDTYVRVLRKLITEATSDLDENETLQDLRRRTIATKASMLRWLSNNPTHPDASRVNTAIAMIESAENDYAAAYADRGATHCRALYFRVRERSALIAGVESAVPVQNKARKVMLLVDKSQWAVWSKDGKDMLHAVKYVDMVELRIGKGEVALVWRNVGDNKVYGWCITAREEDLAVSLSELWRRIRPARMGMSLRCVGNLHDELQGMRVALHLTLENVLRILPPIGGGSKADSVATSSMELNPTAVISELLPNDPGRSVISALSSAQLSRFGVRVAYGARMFEAESELQANVWIAVLMVPTGQTYKPSKPNKQNTSPKPAAARAMSPPKTGSVRAASPDKGKHRLAGPSGSAIGQFTPPSSPARSSPTTVAQRAVSPRRALAVLREAVSPTAPRGRFDSAPPAPQQVLVSAPKQPAQALPPQPKPVAQQAPVSQLPLQPARTSIDAPRPSTAAQPPIGPSITKVLTDHLTEMQAFHEKVPEGAFKAALLNQILDLEEIQYHLVPKEGDLPAFLQTLSAELAKPERLAQLRAYFTADASGVKGRYPEEHLRPFRLLAKMQDLVRADLQITQELRMRKQLLYNQLVDVLKALNAYLPMPAPAPAVVRVSPNGSERDSSPVTKQALPNKAPAAQPRSDNVIAAAAAAAAASVPQRAQVVWHWAADGPNEVSVAQGEVVQVKAQASADWWFIEGRAGTGYVPANHLRMLP